MVQPPHVVFTHRPALPQDLPSIVEIYNQTIPSRSVTADLEPVSVESRKSWFEQHTGARPLWVLEQEQRIIAWLSVSSFYGRPAYDNTAELSLYVSDGWRRRGVGSYLLAAAIAHAPRLDLDTLLGFIFGHNEPSLELFERHGFSRWGLLPGIAVLDGIKRDVVIVGRRV